MELPEDYIDPAEFLGKQDALFVRKKKRQEGDLEEWYADLCRACREVEATPAGKAMLKGLKRLTQYGSTAFRVEDNFNTHSAAARDGAHGLITEIITGAKVAVKLQRKTLQQ